MRLCEKIGTLSESNALKDHSNEYIFVINVNNRLMKKDLEKRMAEMKVLEGKLSVYSYFLYH